MFIVCFIVYKLRIQSCGVVLNACNFYCCRTSLSKSSIASGNFRTREASAASFRTTSFSCGSIFDDIATESNICLVCVCLCDALKSFQRYSDCWLRLCDDALQSDFVFAMLSDTLSLYICGNVTSINLSICV